MSLLLERASESEGVKLVLRLSLPNIGSNLTYVIVSSLVLLLVSPLGKEVIAGVGFASTLVWILYGIDEVAYTGISVLSAIKAGKGGRTGRFVWYGLLLSLIFSLPFTLFGLKGAESFLEFFSLEDGVIKASLSYLTPLLFTLPLILWTNNLNAYFNGLGKMKEVFQSTLVAGALNLGSALFLVPKLGALGAGIAAAAGEVGALFLYLIMCFRERSTNPTLDFKFSLRELGEILKLGFPAGVEESLSSLSYNAFVGLIATCGTAVLAGFEIGLKIESFSIAVSSAIAEVAVPVIGQNWGAGSLKGVEKGVRALLKTSLSFSFVLSLVLVLTAEPLSSLFSREKEVLSWSVTYITFAAVSQPFFTLSSVMSGILKGAGRTELPPIVNLSSFWLVRIAPSKAALSLLCTPLIPWSAMVADYLVRSFTLWKLWKRVKRATWGAQ
jgi:putative MATE family efflux protein